MDLISSFAISYAAGIALNYWVKYNSDVDKEIKKVFSETIDSMSSDKFTKNTLEHNLKKYLQSIKENGYPKEEEALDPEVKEFLAYFNKKICEHPTAYSYLSTINSENQFKDLIQEIKSVEKISCQTLSQVNTVGETINKSYALLEDMHSTMCAKTPILNKQTPPTIKKDIDLKHLLFTHYSKDAEDFYLERDIDIEVISCLNDSSVWIYGASGMGKTSLISRNLSKGDINYIYCDCAAVDIESADDILKEIISTIEINEQEISCFQRTANIVRDTCNILKIINKKDIVIAIDELSIDDSVLVEAITSRLLKLVDMHCRQCPNTKLRFIISTKYFPPLKDGAKGKAMETFDFIELDSWNGDLASLLQLIERKSNLTLTNEMSSTILQSSEKSPRLLKNILRKIIRLDILTEENVKQISEKIRQEHF